MKTADLLRMCRENLFRRKARTFLSVLGVVIGCCSILLMLSIAVGLNASNEEMLKSMGDLSKIDVYSNYDATGMEETSLNEDTVRSIRGLEHVDAVLPRYGMSDLTFRLSCGNNRRYTVPYAEIAAYETDVMDRVGYKLLDGTLPEKSDTVAMGQYFEYTLMDSRRPEGRNQISYYEYVYSSDAGELPEPYQKMMNDTVTLEILDENENIAYSTQLRICGQVKEDYAVGYESCEGLVLRAEDLRRIIKDACKALGQKPRNTYITSISVMADDIRNVSTLEEEIRNLGYSTSSMESMRESTQKEMATIQLVLGGIGAVSLLVAAIGIINTMIMSVSERTKEIGIMKAVGCYVRDIRKLFLLEAASIGFLGGLIGSVASFIISCIINLIAGQHLSMESGETMTVFQMLFTSPQRISVIPIWLFLFGLGFSVFIGLAAGFYPANKAVKISALEAMRNE
ncbi:MAG: ABC transporter permease [Oscillospiraceae bacterium]|nr:ABC transporter permease [Oscillospiraceae bacterium]